MYMRRSGVPAAVLALLLAAVWTGCGDQAAPAAGDEEQAKAVKAASPEAAGEAKAEAEKTAAAEATGEAKAKAERVAPTVAAVASLDAGNKAILANATAFDVVVKSYDKDKKMRTIRAIRKFSDASLKETVDALEKGSAPVAQGLDRNQAEAVLAELGKTGAIVELKAGRKAPKTLAAVREPVDLAAAPKGIDGCPTKGPAKARVTLVEFTDYQ